MSKNYPRQLVGGALIYALEGLTEKELVALGRLLSAEAVRKFILDGGLEKVRDEKVQVRDE